MNHSRQAFFRLSCADKSRHRKRRSRTEGGHCKQKAIGCSCRNDRASGPILSTCWRDLRRPKFASSCSAEAKLLLDRRSLKLVSSGIAGCKRFLAVLRASHHGSPSRRLEGHKILKGCRNNLPISFGLLWFYELHDGDVGELHFHISLL